MTLDEALTWAAKHARKARHDEWDHRQYAAYLERVRHPEAQTSRIVADMIAREAEGFEAILSGVADLRRQRDDLHASGNRLLEEKRLWRAGCEKARALAGLQSQRIEELERRLEAVEDRAEGLETELFEAVQVAYRRGATEWARLNFPEWFARLEADAARHEKEGQS